jgi:hypothetical protein
MPRFARSNLLPTLSSVVFTHSAGDLDLMACDAAGDLVGRSTGTANAEQVSVPAGGNVKVFGYNGAQGGYRILLK